VDRIRISSFLLFFYLLAQYIMGKFLHIFTSTSLHSCLEILFDGFLYVLGEDIRKLGG